jgi:hypothetical protein
VAEGRRHREREREREWELPAHLSEISWGVIIQDVYTCCCLYERDSLYHTMYIAKTALL